MQLNPKRARHGQLLADVEVQMKLVESVTCREVGSDVTEGVIRDQRVSKERSKSSQWAFKAQASLLRTGRFLH